MIVLFAALSATHDERMFDAAIMRTLGASSRQMIARYAERSARDLANLHWYVGFGYFKLAVVAEGFHHRFLAG